MSDKILRQAHFSDSTIELEEITERLTALFCDLITCEINPLDCFIFL